VSEREQTEKGANCCRQRYELDVSLMQYYEKLATRSVVVAAKTLARKREWLA
jgi:hypothetical protein